MDNMYCNRHTRISLDILNEKLLDYYKACVAVDFFETNPIRKKGIIELQLEMDEFIENKVLPKIEKSIMSEIHMGGSHDIAKKQSNGETVFEVNGVPFCNYKALTSAIEKKLDFSRPLEYYINGKYPKAIMEDVNECLHDYEKISLDVVFAEKYRPIPLREGSDAFLKSLLDKIGTHDLLVTGLSGDISAFGFIRNSDDFQLEVMRFIMEGTDYPIAFRNGRMVFMEKFNVDKIMIGLTCTRNDASENFVVTQGMVTLFSDERGASITIDTLFNKEIGAEYGTLFTKGAYVEAVRKFDEAQEIRRRRKRGMERGE